MCRPCGSLSEVWVLLDGVPPLMRGLKSIWAFSEMVGIPREVDEQSLTRVGMVRVRVASPVLEFLAGSIQIFPAAEGFAFRVPVEGAPFPAPPSPPPPPHPASSER